MEIRKGKLSEYQDVRAFYHSLIDEMADAEYGVGWIKDIYPAPEFLMDSLRNGELFVGVENESIIAAMVLNHECNDSYRDFTWPTKAEESEITVIHALGVHPSHGRRGYARQLVRYAIDYARKSGQKVIRLDVLAGNLPAEKLYEGMGFDYLYTLPMYYEDTGWTDFMLYEYIV